MGSLLLGGLVFVFLSMATSIGLMVRARLPDHHLNAESKDVIRLATAVVGTLSALALGLLIASAKALGEYQDIEAVQGDLRSLLPKDAVQRSLQARTLEVSGMLAETHWLLVESGKEGLPWAFLAVLVCWLGLLFATFGLQAPANPTVLSILLVCALSVAGAIFLVSDMANPYVGLIRVSDAPLQSAIERLGKP